MRYFPLFFDLNGRTVIVVGGEEEAAQKLRLLLKTNANINIIAEKVTSEIAEYIAAERINWLAKVFAPDLLNGASLVYATQGEQENIIVAHAARERKILVNAVDMPELCDVITPAIVDRDPVVIAIGTEGAAPVLARQIKSHLEGHLPQNLGVMARAARKLRTTVAATLSNGKSRRFFWEKFCSGKIKALFLGGDTRSAYEATHKLLQGIEKNANNPENSGRISLVGAGPGAADLLTFRAMQRLQSADVIMVDRAIDPAILECARRDAIRINLSGALQNRHEVRQTLLREAAKGNHVVYLRGASAAHFSQLRDDLRARDITNLAIDIVPGVASVSNVPAKPKENTSNVFPLRPNTTPTAKRLTVPSSRL